MKPDIGEGRLISLSLTKKRGATLFPFHNWEYWTDPRAWKSLGGFFITLFFLYFLFFFFLFLFSCFFFFCHFLNWEGFKWLCSRTSPAKVSNSDSGWVFCCYCPRNLHRNFTQKSKLFCIISLDSSIIRCTRSTNCPRLFLKCQKLKTTFVLQKTVTSFSAPLVGFMGEKIWVRPRWLGIFLWKTIRIAWTHPPKKEGEKCDKCDRERRTTNPRHTKEIKSGDDTEHERGEGVWER